MDLWLCGQRRRHSAEYTARAALLLLHLLAHGRAAGQEEETIYVRPGSNVLIPGVETELKGKGALAWTVEKTGGAGPVPILSYHYGSPEAEVQQDYQHRVNLSFTNGLLQLFNFSIQDSGLYTLNLMFEDKKYKHIIQVVEPVSEIKVVKIWFPRECIVLLRCEALGDVMNMMWKTNGGELIHNVTRLGNILELTVKVDSSGNYTCVAWNPVSKLEKTYQFATESYVGLLLIGLHIAALIFSILNLSRWTTFQLSKFRFCHNAKIGATAEWPALVSWFFFSICSLISASVAQFISTAQSANVVYPSTVPYGWPGFNVFYLVVLTSCLVLDVLLFLRDRLKISLKQCSRFKGPLQIANIVLQLCALGLSIAALIYYLMTYFTACRQPYGFVLTIFISVLVPVMIIAIIYGSRHYCCLNVFLGDSAARSSLEGNQHNAMEIEMPVNTSTYRDVATEEGFAIS